MSRIKIEVEGGPDVLRQLQKLEGFDRVATKHVRGAMRQTVGEFVSSWREIAPYRLGTYQGSIVGQVMKVDGLFSRGIVSTDVTRSGFPYPAILELSESLRASPNPHRGQVTRLAEKMKSALVARFQEVASRILEELVVR